MPRGGKRPGAGAKPGNQNGRKWRAPTFDVFPIKAIKQRVADVRGLTPEEIAGFAAGILLELCIADIPPNVRRQAASDLLRTFTQPEVNIEELDLDSLRMHIDELLPDTAIVSGNIGVAEEEPDA